MLRLDFPVILRAKVISSKHTEEYPKPRKSKTLFERDSTIARFPFFARHRSARFSVYQDHHTRCRVPRSSLGRAISGFVSIRRLGRALSTAAQRNSTRSEKWRAISKFKRAGQFEGPYSKTKCSGSELETDYCPKEQSPGARRLRAASYSSKTTNRGENVLAFQSKS